jgi:hypothetical protein
MGFRLSPTDAVNFFIKTMKDKKNAAQTKIKLKNTFKDVSPSLFFGNDVWSGTKSALVKDQYKITLSEANLNQIAKNAKIPKLQIKSVAGGKKTTIVTVNGYTINFKTTKKTGTSSDAASTRKQELASLWMIRSALSPGPKLYKDWDAVTKDKKAFQELTDIYPELITTATEWQAGLCKQQAEIEKKLQGGGRYTEFVREGGFMKFISKLVKDEFMIGRKDSWNPADVWVIRKGEKIETTLEKAAKGGITRLNETMIQMWHARKLKGISLKAISGSKAEFEVVNVEEALFKKMDNSVFELDKIEIPLNLVNGEFDTQDSKIHIKEGETKLIKFQVTQNSKGFNNLKIEGTMVGAGAARAGKVPLDMMKTMMSNDYKNQGISFSTGQFTNKWQDYPKTLAEFNKDSQIYSEMWNTIKDKVISGIKTKQEFDASFQSAWNTQEDIASSKLMQLTFIHAVLKMQEKPQKEFLTNLTFLAQKKGRKFGPFGKLY